MSCSYINRGVCFNSVHSCELKLTAAFGILLLKYGGTNLQNNNNNNPAK